MKKWEYRTVLVPLDPTNGARTDVALNAYGEEGWEVVILSPLAQQVGHLVGHQKVEMAFLGVLKREKIS